MLETNNVSVVSGEYAAAGSARDVKVRNEKSSGPFAATQMWNMLLRSFKDGMPVGRHRKGFKSYQNCFIGSDAVSWMHDNMQNLLKTDVTRSQVVTLLEKFYKVKLFRDVDKSSEGTEFCEGSKLYRFSTEEEEEGSDVLELAVLLQSTSVNKSSSKPSSSLSSSSSSMSPNRIFRRFNLKSGHMDVNIPRSNFKPKVTNSNKMRQKLNVSDVVVMVNSNIFNSSNVVNDSSDTTRNNNFYNNNNISNNNISNKVNNNKIGLSRGNTFSFSSKMDPQTPQTSQTPYIALSETQARNFSLKKFVTKKTETKLSMHSNLEMNRETNVESDDFILRNPNFRDESEVIKMEVKLAPLAFNIENGFILGLSSLVADPSFRNAVGSLDVNVQYIIHNVSIVNKNAMPTNIDKKNPMNNNEKPDVHVEMKRENVAGSNVSNNNTNNNNGCNSNGNMNNNNNNNNKGDDTMDDDVLDLVCEYTADVNDSALISPQILQIIKLAHESQRVQAEISQKIQQKRIHNQRLNNKFENFLHNQSTLETCFGLENKTPKTTVKMSSRLSSSMYAKIGDVSKFIDDDGEGVDDENADDRKMTFYDFLNSSPPPKIIHKGFFHSQFFFLPANKQWKTKKQRKKSITKSVDNIAKGGCSISNHSNHTTNNNTKNDNNHVNNRSSHHYHNLYTEGKGKLISMFGSIGNISNKNLYNNSNNTNNNYNNNENNANDHNSMGAYNVKNSKERKVKVNKSLVDDADEIMKMLIDNHASLQKQQQQTKSVANVETTATQLNNNNILQHSFETLSKSSAKTPPYIPTMCNDGVKKINPSATNTNNFNKNTRIFTDSYHINVDNTKHVNVDNNDYCYFHLSNIGHQHFNKTSTNDTNYNNMSLNNAANYNNANEINRDINVANIPNSNNLISADCNNTNKMNSNKDALIAVMQHMMLVLPPANRRMLMILVRLLSKIVFPNSSSSDVNSNNNINSSDINSDFYSAYEISRLDGKQIKLLDAFASFILSKDSSICQSSMEILLYMMRYYSSMFKVPPYIHGNKLLSFFFSESKVRIHFHHSRLFVPIRCLKQKYLHYEMVHAYNKERSRLEVLHEQKENVSYRPNSWQTNLHNMHVQRPLKSILKKNVHVVKPVSHLEAEDCIQPIKLW
ncbi:hypothetical protein HELRODRAFT_188886 [Helobdella robusta]|uniref:DEP domain-containing protein n=1 Tax=Helobdella robusta TaxID=6412 RepID=T1FQF7_HELRO|nr:hypothetical protein HELRODRAFT_188886 [Helobdella robusta]ESN98705.1 hypothetical protein HELRODRAFT_188886 [Helobdella robusta]